MLQVTEPASALAVSRLRLSSEYCSSRVIGDHWQLRGLQQDAVGVDPGGERTDAQSGRSPPLAPGERRRHLGAGRGGLQRALATSTRPSARGLLPRSAGSLTAVERLGRCHKERAAQNRGGDCRLVSEPWRSRASSPKETGGSCKPLLYLRYAVAEEWVRLSGHA